MNDKKLNFRRNVDISELINRFEIDDDLSTRTNDDDYLYDQNRLLMKYNKNVSYDEYDYKNQKRDQKYQRRDKIKNAKLLTRQTITQFLSRVGGFFEMMSRFPFPRMSPMSFGLMSLLTIFICPRGMGEKFLYPGFRVLFGIIYPAYSSFKAVRNKSLKEYVKWMIYWITYSCFTCIEIICDLSMSWFPFFYEIKTIVLIWLLGQKGSMNLYKTLIHPVLIKKENEIDGIIHVAQEHGYTQVFKLGSKSVNFANVIMQGPTTDDQCFRKSQQLTKNYSLSDITDRIQRVDDLDDLIRGRNVVASKIPKYGNKYSDRSEFDEQPRRKHSTVSYDEISSSYSSPEVSKKKLSNERMQSRMQIEDDLEDKRRNSYRDSYKQYSDTKNYTPDYDHFYDLPKLTRRQSSITELTADELKFAYEQIQIRKEKEIMDFSIINVPKEYQEKYKEFEQWLESRKTKAERDSDRELEERRSIEEELKKVIVVEESITNDDINVVTNTCNENEQTISKQMETNVAEIVEGIAEVIEVIADFDEFKDVVSSDEENDDYLAVPLFITEEKEQVHTEDVVGNERDLLVKTEVMIPTVSVDEEKSDERENIVAAKMTLSNYPLEIKASVTTLSLSNTSLDRSSSSESIVKRPVNHTKGRAPPPPPPPTLVTPTSEQGDANTVPGLYYDTTSKKHFKETEL